jgi:L-ascorbate metabolism protein UlaG (beta-lactamase superfamily)
MLASCRSSEVKKTGLQSVHNSPNCKNGVFINPVHTDIYTGSNLWDVTWRWITKRNRVLEPTQTLKFKSDATFHSPLSDNGLRIVWIGHSTLLIEIDGKRFLTDPVWSKRATPVRPFGPVRFFDPPIALEDIPKIDGIIISHDHFDHLDCATIQKLGKTGVTFYAPLGVGQHLEAWGISNDRIKEMDWWDKAFVGKGHSLVATPARHFSGRSLFRRNRTLWCSWVIKGSTHRVFFGGDGGMWPGFKAIGDKYGPFDISFVQIGAYNSDWKNIHMFPEEAVQAHLDLKGNVLVPIHWGTFNLAFHTWTEPVERLLTSAKENNIRLSLPEPGQSIKFPETSINSYWWTSGT